MSIEYIDIVHHLHTDLGYTDHPLRARQLHARAVGQAVDAVLATDGQSDPFAWTCETLLGVDEYLQNADDGQRERFYRAVKTGNLDIGALPFVVTPFLNAQEWDKMLHWMPEDFYKDMSVQTAMQNDINGFPAAAVEKLLDRGVRYLWMGPNLHLGGVPFTTPHAFKWRMADGRSMLVWLNGHYNNGFYIFNEFWREGPIPNSYDTCYRWPDEKDIFRTDDASMEKAHTQCLKCMAAFEGREPNAGQFERDGFIFNKITGVYPYRTLCLSLTNHWRMDNDPPILHLHEFVRKWNEKGYTPKLRLVTATQAMRHIEEEIGDNADVVEGEWPDWWANGIISAPRELGWAREAGRVYETAVSPLLGEMTAEDEKCAAEILRNLCMYKEHTFSNWKSVAEPYHFDVISAQAEIAILSYRALDAARNLLADRLRAARGMDQEGVWVLNAAQGEYSGWISIPGNCLRGSFSHLRNGETNELYRLYPYASAGEYNKPKSAAEVSAQSETTDFPDLKANFTSRFWIQALPADSFVKLIPCNAEDGEKPSELPIEIHSDALGWPEYVCYAGRKESLIRPGFADFTSVTVDGFAPRWQMLDIFDHVEADPGMAERILNVDAQYMTANRVESEHDICFEQSFAHPSLHWGQRRLILSKHEPRARLELKLRRKDNPRPEIFFCKVQMAARVEELETSLAGRSFVPGAGQIPNTCKDYYAIDGWVRYGNGATNWSIAAHEAAMVSFGKPNSFAKLKALPQDVEKLFFILYDNSWDTNFHVNANGLFEYNFDLKQTYDPEEADMKSTLRMKPSVLVNLRS